MTTTLRPDICVIGAGSGGLTVAAAAASFGVDVVLIEKGKMGGDCLNYGCVPSKAIIAAGKHAHAIAEAPHFGVHAGDMKVDYKKVHAHIHSVIDAIAPNDSVERFTALGVKVIEAAGAFTDANTVVAGDYEIKARRFVIATGSSPFVPPIPGIDTVDYLTNETLFDRTQRARHLIVVGGGPIGMEMAQAHRRLGSDVTVIEGLKALGKDDPELAAIVLDRIRAEGVEIMEGATVTGVKKFGRAGVRVSVDTADGEKTVDGSHILVATGRAANVEGLGLSEAGVEYDRRGIKVKPNMKTTNKRVFAIGDVAGGLQFTHVAGYHAGLVIQQILFRAPAKENTRIIPWATYTDPELAHVGLSEEEARKRFGQIHVLRWPYAENDRALAERKTDGLIKLVTDRKGRIAGVSIAGAGAGEMINMWALAIANGMRLSNVRGYVPPYPTMAEIGKRAVISYYSPMTRKPFIRSIIGFLRRFG
ncbi:dihydrolipoyl dehydrogenase family protein [Hoeflea prorocentri]|uniref:FAD-dependent oxidoreductase n=1 Tax=Hoeflea prorocentri TaxID=1922333 RepID=A0A9X3UL97_9HYPH|nr:FAD-dependent oxidoreductase [Hoeflea prorocentri]MCY6382704.1 FAD-dependent oxidoreductase [Hoeflea prorocentri]MDA5400504.1 FAD-dependent oxidoreductase [Hoeflea prorocentri]